MHYIDKEEESEYIELWLKYPDPPKKAIDSIIPTWLHEFEDDSSAIKVRIDHYLQRYKEEEENNENNEKESIENDENYSLPFFIWENNSFGIVLIIKTLYKHVARIPLLKTVIGDPVEYEMVFESTEIIDTYYDELERILKSNQIPLAFIINIDESCYSELFDVGKINVVVPSTCSSEEIKVLIRQCCKRSSMVFGICADGSTIKPGVAIPRKAIGMDTPQIKFV